MDSQNADIEKLGAYLTRITKFTEELTDPSKQLGPMLDAAHQRIAAAHTPARRAAAMSSLNGKIASWVAEHEMLWSGMSALVTEASALMIAQVDHWDTVSISGKEEIKTLYRNLMEVQSVAGRFLDALEPLATAVRGWSPEMGPARFAVLSRIDPLREHMQSILRDHERLEEKVLPILRPV